MAEKLDAHTKVLVYSASGKQSKWATTLEQVASADYVMLAIPLDAYADMLEQLKPLLAPHSVLVDVCSVKEKPLRIIREHLPDHRLLATHPLFGPESAARSLKGHVLVLCPEESDPDALQEAGEFAAGLGLEVKVMSAREHDREMATVHGLTFFIARILKDCSLHDQVLATPSFKRLLSLAELEQHHSDDLFYTIQAGNDQTAEIRDRFIRTAEALNATIHKHAQEQQG